MKEHLPLKEVSVRDLYNGSQRNTYEIPIYQRNYAWERDEIATLIQDVYDAFLKAKTDNGRYYIGTLVSYHRGESVYEIIDGQQRLTTIKIILTALGIPTASRLTYRARKKSDLTIRKMPNFTEIDEVDKGIENGYKYAKSSIGEIVGEKELEAFQRFLQDNVHLIHYTVPKDIDLNHYFEIMNSRGEQLEKHEIVKAQMMNCLTTADDRSRFHLLWECCSEMSVYIQQKYNDTKIFGKDHCDFVISKFEDLPPTSTAYQTKTIEQILNEGLSEDMTASTETDRPDSFQPIIDFPNFLLIVLKLTRMREEGRVPTDFNLDDKELLREFDRAPKTEEFVKSFAFDLLKARYLLDNFVVHHANEEDNLESNPWKLQRWQKEHGGKGYPKNLSEDDAIQQQLVQALSMFEVSFTARQRKNYLFYCLLYLFGQGLASGQSAQLLLSYSSFLESLARKYFRDVYLRAENLNRINTPLPGSFDEMILRENGVDVQIQNNDPEFIPVYGDGTERSRGIPLFVFNYLDYLLWRNYAEKLHGKDTKEENSERREFFATLGCSDFGLKIFQQFYFSRTRRSLEHFFPQANVSPETLNEDQINCLGNYAMIGSEANSLGSNWSPKTKLDHYLDVSGKIRQVSVASLKFMVMMQMCKDNQAKRTAGEEWTFEDIREHQEKMLAFLLG
jgi:hypothetical protein